MILKAWQNRLHMSILNRIVLIVYKEKWKKKENNCELVLPG